MTMTKDHKITAYKGFNADWTCRGFQYEVGKTYTHDGDVGVCNAGFHACENPLEVFQHYAPTGNFSAVEMSGNISKSTDGDTKLASAQISVTVELSMHDFIGRAVAWLTVNAKSKAKHATGYQSAASATGYQSAASVTGDQSAALGAGYENKVMGKNGCALFLVERDGNYTIINARAGIVGRDLVEGIWYSLIGGEFVEVK